MTRIEECNKCQKPFTVAVSGEGSLQDSSDIDCPHCGDMWGREETATAYVTQPLTPEQEKEHRQRKK